MFFAGIDAGSRTLKAVLLEGGSRKVVASGVVDQGVDQAALARDLLARLLARAGLERGRLRRVVATGYGRKLVREADRDITEITCQARGARHVRPGARTVVDIGGQDSKCLRLDPEGRVVDFSMNDRCAAGTGRFLEVVACRLGMTLDECGRRADASSAPAAISSVCVVFAETEIVGLLASGVAPADIAAGVQRAVSVRVAAMAGGEMEEPLLFTGGVALVPGMARALAAACGREVEVAPAAQLTAALGAALLGADAG